MPLSPLINRNHCLHKASALPAAAHSSTSDAERTCHHLIKQLISITGYHAAANLMGKLLKAPLMTLDNGLSTDRLMQVLADNASAVSHIAGEVAKLVAAVGASGAPSAFSAYDGTLANQLRNAVPELALVAHDVFQSVSDSADGMMPQPWLVLTACLAYWYHNRNQPRLPQPVNAAWRLLANLPDWFNFLHGAAREGAILTGSPPPAVNIPDSRRVIMTAQPNVANIESVTSAASGLSLTPTKLALTTAAGLLSTGILGLGPGLVLMIGGLVMVGAGVIPPVTKRAHAMPADTVDKFCITSSEEPVKHETGTRNDIVRTIGNIKAAEYTQAHTDATGSDYNHLISKLNYLTRTKSETETNRCSGKPGYCAPEVPFQIYHQAIEERSLPLEEIVLIVKDIARLRVEYVKQSLQNNKENYVERLCATKAAIQGNFNDLKDLTGKVNDANVVIVAYERSLREINQRYVQPSQALTQTGIDSEVIYRNTENIRQQPFINNLIKRLPSDTPEYLIPVDDFNQATALPVNSTIKVAIQETSGINYFFHIKIPNSRREDPQWKEHTCEAVNILAKVARDDRGCSQNPIVAAGAFTDNEGVIQPVILSSGNDILLFIRRDQGISTAQWFLSLDDPMFTHDRLTDINNSRFKKEIPQGYFDIDLSVVSNLLKIIKTGNINPQQQTTYQMDSLKKITLQNGRYANTGHFSTPWMENDIKNGEEKYLEAGITFYNNLSEYLLSHLSDQTLPALSQIYLVKLMEYADIGVFSATISREKFLDLYFTTHLREQQGLVNKNVTYHYKETYTYNSATTDDNWMTWLIKNMPNLLPVTDLFTKTVTVLKTSEMPLTTYLTDESARARFCSADTAPVFIPERNETLMLQVNRKIDNIMYPSEIRSETLEQLKSVEGNYWTHKGILLLPTIRETELAFAKKSFATPSLKFVFKTLINLSITAKLRSVISATFPPASLKLTAQEVEHYRNMASEALSTGENLLILKHAGEYNDGLILLPGMTSETYLFLPFAGQEPQQANISDMHVEDSLIDYLSHFFAPYSLHKSQLVIHGGDEGPPVYTTLADIFQVERNPLTLLDNLYEGMSSSELARIEATYLTSAQQVSHDVASWTKRYSGFLNTAAIVATAAALAWPMLPEVLALEAVPGLIFELTVDGLKITASSMNSLAVMTQTAAPLLMAISDSNKLAKAGEDINELMEAIAFNLLLTVPGIAGPKQAEEVLQREKLALTPAYPTGNGLRVGLKNMINGPGKRLDMLEGRHIRLCGPENLQQLPKGSEVFIIPEGSDTIDAAFISHGDGKFWRANANIPGKFEQLNSASPEDIQLTSGRLTRHQQPISLYVRDTNPTLKALELSNKYRVVESGTKKSIVLSEEQIVQEKDFLFYHLSTSLSEAADIPDSDAISSLLTYNQLTEFSPSGLNKEALSVTISAEGAAFSLRGKEKLPVYKQAVQFPAEPEKLNEITLEKFWLDQRPEMRNPRIAKEYFSANPLHEGKARFINPEFIETIRELDRELSTVSSAEPQLNIFKTVKKSQRDEIMKWYQRRAEIDQAILSGIEIVNDEEKIIANYSEYLHRVDGIIPVEGHLGDRMQALSYQASAKGFNVDDKYVTLCFTLKPGAHKRLFSPAWTAIMKDSDKPILAAIATSRPGEIFQAARNGEGLLGGSIGLKPEARGGFSLGVGKSSASNLALQTFVAEIVVIEPTLEEQRTLLARWNKPRSAEWHPGSEAAYLHPTVDNLQLPGSDSPSYVNPFEFKRYSQGISLPDAAVVAAETQILTQIEQQLKANPLINNHLSGLLNPTHDAADFIGLKNDINALHATQVEMTAVRIVKSWKFDDFGRLPKEKPTYQYFPLLLRENGVIKSCMLYHDATSYSLVPEEAWVGAVQHEPDFINTVIKYQDVSAEDAGVHYNSIQRTSLERIFPPDTIVNGHVYPETIVTNTPEYTSRYGTVDKAYIFPEGIHGKKVSVSRHGGDFILYSRPLSEGAQTTDTLNLSAHGSYDSGDPVITLPQGLTIEYQAPPGNTLISDTRAPANLASGQKKIYSPYEVVRADSQAGSEVTQPDYHLENFAEEQPAQLARNLNTIYEKAPHPYDIVTIAPGKRTKLRALLRSLGEMRTATGQPYQKIIFTACRVNIQDLEAYRFPTERETNILHRRRKREAEEAEEAVYLVPLYHLTVTLNDSTFKPQPIRVDMVSHGMALVTTGDINLNLNEQQDPWKLSAEELMYLNVIPYKLIDADAAQWFDTLQAQLLDDIKQDLYSSSDYLSQLAKPLRQLVSFYMLTNRDLHALDELHNALVAKVESNISNIELLKQLEALLDLFPEQL